MTTANSITPARPRLSAIPTPGTRSRSSSNVYQSKSAHPQNDDISRALADAIRANDPSHHRPLPLSATASSSSLSPQTLSYSLSSGSRSVAARPSSSASTASRAKTPVSARPSSRPPSRQSDASSRLSKSFDIGENVRIESLGFEGTLRFIGDIDGKPGLWAGVELSGGFAGKGKNNGSVAGYDHCISLVHGYSPPLPANNTFPVQRNVVFSWPPQNFHLLLLGPAPFNVQHQWRPHEVADQPLH